MKDSPNLGCCGKLKIVLTHAKLFSLIIGFAITRINNIEAQTPIEDYTVTYEMSFQTHEMNGADFASPLTTFNGSIYYAYIDPDLKGKIAKKSADGTITEKTIINSVKFDNHHNELSIAIDNDGYVHLVGNVHGNAMRYWRSANPEDISNFISYDDDVARGGILGHAVSYPRFFKNRKGTLFLTFRDELADVNIHGRVAGWLGGCIVRYNSRTKRWTSLGSTDYSFKDKNGIQIKGNDIGGRNVRVVVWNESGVGTNFGRSYQGYKMRMVVDKNNRLHLVWNVGVGKDNVSGNVASDATHLMYAYSDNEGDTWRKADGAILQLPMTTENADVVYHQTDGRLYNFMDIVIGRDNNPIILQRNSANMIPDSQVMAFNWNGSSWKRINWDGHNWTNTIDHFPVFWVGLAATDFYEHITTFHNIDRLGRSWDGGRTWVTYENLDNYDPVLTGLDFEYLYRTGDLRFQRQYIENNAHYGMVVTIDFEGNNDFPPPVFNKKSVKD